MLYNIFIRLFFPNDNFIVEYHKNHWKRCFPTGFYHQIKQFFIQLHIRDFLERHKLFR